MMRLASSAMLFGVAASLEGHQRRRRPPTSAWATNSAADCIATDEPAPPLQPGPAPRASKGLRIAIATLISANNQDPCLGYGQMRPYGCGLLPWCTSARRLQAALAPMFRSVEVVAVHSSRLPEADSQFSSDERRRRAGKSVAVTRYEGKVRRDCRFNMDTERLDVADCPGVRIVTPTRRMLNVSAQHAERVIASGLMSYYPDYIRRGYVFLWKFEYWRLKYDAILHADLDVDLLPSPMLAHRIASEWAERLPPLVSLAKGGGEGGNNVLRMLGYSDPTTPYNGGLFWAFPSGEARGGSFYKDGLDVLSAPWDPHLGWNRAGPPSSLFPPENTSARRADGEILRRRPAGFAEKSWTKIDSGDLDQGFLLYMMQHRHHVGAYMRGDSFHQPAHVVMHKFKLWMRALNYFSFTPETACTQENLIRQAYIRGYGLDKGDTQSACAVAFRAVAAELDAQMNRSTCCASQPQPPSGSLGRALSSGNRRGYGAVPLSVF